MIKHWILAARPKTLPAAVAPVMVGSALAVQHGQFKAIPGLLCLLFAMLIQIATNFANDYFDFKKGTDNENRKGPKRAVAQGWISPKSMLIATGVVLFLAFLSGINLVWFGGLDLIIIGVLSMAFAVLYTGGPYPLAYLGLGDVFVLIFFGWVAVMYTYYVQAGHHNWEAFHLGTAVGCLSMNLLLINNYRDVDNDRVSNKRTTVVKFGKRYGRWQYRVALIATCLLTCWVAYHSESFYLIFALLPVLPGFLLANQLKSAESEITFGKLLQQTSVILVFYSISSAILLISF